MFDDLLKRLLRLDDDNVVERMNEIHNVWVFRARVAEYGRAIFVDKSTNEMQQHGGILAARKRDEAAAVETGKKILDGSNGVIELLIKCPALPLLQFF